MKTFAIPMDNDCRNDFDRPGIKRDILMHPGRDHEPDSNPQLEDRLQKKIMFLLCKNKASRKGYKGECSSIKKMLSF